MSQTDENKSLITADELTERLRERIAENDGFNGDGSELKLIKEVHRRFCKLYLYQLSLSGSCALVVKIPIGHSDIKYQSLRDNNAFVDRPRLFERAISENKARMEYAALCRIQSHFDAAGDRRFGIVRVYDFLPESQAMVMQWVDQPSLRTLLYKSHRLTSSRQARQLEGAFCHTGAWLRCHHGLPPLPHSATRNTSRDAYLQAVDRFVAYLADHLGDRNEILKMHEQIIALAEDHIPETVATGQVHGDFAPRNIFIGRENRVSVFDTLGRFEAPIYEDVAKMLMSVRASGPQLFSRGLLYEHSRLTRYEQCFLEGYFSEQPVPLPTIQLYLSQQILEHWSAIVYRHQEQRGVKRVAKRMRRMLWEPGLREYLKEILSGLLLR